MTFSPGSVQFRQFIQNKFPRLPFEQVSEWLIRVNDELELQPQSRLKKLYYDQGLDNARFTTTEYQSIFGYPAKSSERLAQAQVRKQEINEIIRVHADEITKLVLTNVVQGIQESLQRISG